MSHSPWTRMLSWGWRLFRVRSTTRIRQAPFRDASPAHVLEQRLLLSAQAVADNYTIAVGQTLGPVNVMANDMPTSGLGFMTWNSPPSIPGLT